MKLFEPQQFGPYQIRALAHGDLEELRQLRNASRASFISKKEIGSEVQELWYRGYLEHTHEIVVVAVKSGRIVGMAGLIENVPVNTIEFGRLAVAESERRRGLGYALTERLVTWAFEYLGAERVVLDVLADNASAIALYERLGFRREAGADDCMLPMEVMPADLRPKPKPLVHSVIVGSYNRPTYVRKAIRSVMDQSYQHWQIIVTDDASNEETLGGIREEFGADTRCHLLVTPDRLPDGPRPTGNVRAVDRINDAIPLVTGDIVHYLPDDDWFWPGRFEAFNEVFSDPGVMMACGGLRYADGVHLSPADGIYPGTDVLDPYCVLDQTQVAHRRECFTKVPRWSTTDIAYAADGLFYRHLCQAGYGPIRPSYAIVSVKRRHEFNLISVQTGATDRRE